MSVPKCSYVGCTKPAVRRLLHKYGRFPWFGCTTHWPGMQTALFIGQPSDSGEVYTTVIRP